jgi:hypothetical protein
VECFIVIGIYLVCYAINDSARSKRAGGVRVD